MVLLGAACASSRQRFGALQPGLYAQLEGVADDEFVHVVFHLEGALATDPAQRHQVLAEADGTTPRERRLDGRQLLITALEQDFAARSAGLVSTLDALSARGKVRKVRELFVLGAVACWIQKSALTSLVAHPTVLAAVGDGGIRLDPPVQAFGGASSAGSRSTPSWSVAKIGADVLHSKWSKSGAGVVVAVVDSGFDPLHPDIVGRVSSQWDFEEDDADASGPSPHGTYVAGSVAGTGAGGIQTGVAPGAELMLLRVAAGDGATTQAQVWAAMDHALVNGADIVNLSLWWAVDHSPDEASWRTEIDTLTEAGVLVVTISGNDADQRVKAGGGVYSPPYSVTTPGRVPSALTLGGTDASDELWFDPDPPPFGSNTGPVTWQDVSGFLDYPHEPGLMKPDAVAPAGGVTVTYQGSGGTLYTDKSGTSFAAPHAAGLAALLLESEPDLGPFDLRFLIQETCVDLGSAGPDTQFGWGRIDAQQAHAALPIDATDYDLAISATTSLWTTADLWVDNDHDGVEDTPIAKQDNYLYAQVRNLGGQVVGNVRLEFYYADVSTLGIGGFDPDGDGDPSDGNFTYIGSYTVPLLGPKGSKHDTAIGLVRWEIPMPTSDHWCVGVAALADPPNPPEEVVANNRAFRNFFELVIESSGSLMFSLRPPAERPREPFDLLIRRRGLPEEARLALVVDAALAERLAEALGREPAEGAGAESPATLGRIELVGDTVRFRDLQLADGEPVPATLTVRVPDSVELSEMACVVLCVLDEKGQEAGGLTVRIARDPSPRRVGPYSLKSP